MKFEPLQRVWEHKCNDILFCIAGQAESKRLFFGSSDFGVYEHQSASGSNQRLQFDGGHQSYVTALVSVQGFLVSGSYDRRLIWWDTDDRKPVRTITAHDRWIRRVVAMPDARQIVTVSDDMLCKVWDVETAELLAAFTDHRPRTPHDYPSMLYALGISNDGQYIATGDKTGHVAIWDAATFAKIGELETPTMYTWDPVKRRHSIGGIRSLAFSPDGERLAIGGIGNIGNIDHLGGPARLEVFQWRTGKQLQVTEDEKHKGLIEQIAWAHDASWLLTAGGDHKGFLTFHDATSGKVLQQTGVRGHVHGFLLDQGSRTVTAAGHQQLTQWTF